MPPRLLGNSPSSMSYRLLPMVLYILCSEGLTPSSPIRPLRRTFLDSTPAFHRVSPHDLKKSPSMITTRRNAAEEGGFGNDKDRKEKLTEGAGSPQNDKYSLSDAEMKWMKRQSSSQPESTPRSEPQPPTAREEGYDSISDDDGSGNVNIPKTGISVSDEMVALQTKETFVTRLVPLAGDGCVPDGVDAARIETTVRDQIGEEPARYLVPLERGDSGHEGAGLVRYAMVDVPPFSDELVAEIRAFVSSSPSQSQSPDSADSDLDSDSDSDSEDDKREKRKRTGVLSNILITSRDGIHYDESPAVYVTRKSDLQSWKQAFPEAHIVIYRLDAPRECKDLVTQVLDGYGPWGLQADNNTDDIDNSAKTTKRKSNNTKSTDKTMTFIETGRPLTRMEWSEEVQEQVLDQGMPPPDDTDTTDNDIEGLYTPDAIRAREDGNPILAVYTPGHTFGSVTYVFPNVKICCAGYTIPLEDTRPDAAMGSTMPGPAMDYRGYITTSQGGMGQQIESARKLIGGYGDRFEAVLPARGAPVCLTDGSSDGDSQKHVDYRARVWNQLLDDYSELGDVYEQLGII